MIRETLTAIGQAGSQALVKFAPALEAQTQITQVREWSFAMPNLARVTVANSPIHQVYLGLSRPLAAAVGRRDGGFEVLLEHFKQDLVMRVPAKRPIGAWELVDVGGATHVLRGVRSFILRQQTLAGNLYLMADVASRCEFENLRQETWESDLAAQLLPRDLGRAESVEPGAALERVTTYLARCEHDLEMLVPGSDGNVHSCNAVFLGRTRRDGQVRMLMSLDLDREVRDDLCEGVELEGSFGAAGRVFRFRTVCTGTEGLSLGDVTALPCHEFELPARFSLDQRRRYFRVKPEGPLTGRFQVLPPEVAAQASDDPRAPGVPRPADPPRDALQATVEDLSFSGAGLVFEGQVPEDLARDCLVHLWIDGPELNDTAELTGLVRRLRSEPVGRGRMRTSLGLEFVVRGPRDRRSTQLVRQYVMAQQRRLLATRNADVQPA